MEEIDPGLREALYAFLGSANSVVLQPGSEGPLEAGCPVAVLTHSPTTNSVGTLLGNAFDPTYIFAALPSFKTTRWLIPLVNSRLAARGMQIYAPYNCRGRLLKTILLGLLKTGWTGWARDRVLIASKDPLPLQILIGEVIGEPHPVFALFLGAPGRYRKLTIQVMGRDGEILGYLKMPLTVLATERVRREAAVLERLWNHAALRSHIPKVLYAGEWGNGYVLLQSCGPYRPGPVEFGVVHEKFLRSLWNIQRVEQPGHALVGAVAARWLQAEALLGSGWRALGRRALERARRELRGVMVPSGLSHGDFAPWNSRIGDGRLFLFDWESAGWEVPNLWDVFHFHVQVASLLNGTLDGKLSFGQSAGDRAIGLLYTLNSTCNLIEEMPSCQSGLEYRQGILRRELS